MELLEIIQEVFSEENYNRRLNHTMVNEVRNLSLSELYKSR